MLLKYLGLDFFSGKTGGLRQIITKVSSGSKMLKIKWWVVTELFNPSNEKKYNKNRKVTCIIQARGKKVSCCLHVLKVSLPV